MSARAESRFTSKQIDEALVNARGMIERDETALDDMAVEYADRPQDHPYHRKRRRAENRRELVLIIVQLRRQVEDLETRLHISTELRKEAFAERDQARELHADISMRYGALSAQLSTTQRELDAALTRATIEASRREAAIVPRVERGGEAA